MLYIARGIEDDHYWIVEDWEGVLIETPWRIEHEADGYRLSHADDWGRCELVYALGAFTTANAAMDHLSTFVE